MAEQYWTEEHSIAYCDVSDQPLLRCITNNTLHRYMKNLNDKTILDVGCGEGKFLRFAKKNGASYCLGVDMSPYMLKIAKEYDAKEGIYCDYKMGDARTLEKFGEFDIVAMSNVFHYAKTFAELLGMCRGFYDNLKPGNSFYGIAFNTYSDLNRGHSLAKYGLDNLVRIEKLEDSTQYDICSYTPENGRSPIHLPIYFFEPEMYMKAFNLAGFQSVQVKPVTVDESMMAEFPEGFWKDYLENPPQICYVARK